MSAVNVQPTLVTLAMGDPAGISPELTARVVADREMREIASLVVIGDARVLEDGARVAGVRIDVDTVTATDEILSRPGVPVLVDLGHLNPASIERGKISRAGGAFARDNYVSALALARAGAAQAATFTPFNKAAMRLAIPGYEDEIAITCETLGFKGEAREFNVLEGLWNARVTSHVPLRDVATLLSVERIVRGLRLTHDAMFAAGFPSPRIAVAGLNPHAGDNGNFGREEIDILEPAVAEAKSQGIACSGPYPSDTVFVRARGGEFDAVLTMYHDQGQIAMKLIGFDKGVTLLGGMPVPVCTPAHGTAYDIAGKGIANTGATFNAIRLAARMGGKVARTRREPISVAAARRAIGLDTKIAAA
jgi:4-hydroxythreonine-4-phosphate dehydrogenase